jgi:hypothetical protein
MNASALLHVALNARLALKRTGLLRLGAPLLIGISAGAWVAWVPRLAAQAEQARHALEAAQARGNEPKLASSAAPVPSAGERLRAFRAALGDVRQADTSLQAIFAAGEQSRLVLDKADYKLSYDKAGRFWTYAVQLPVTGSYAAIRAFSENVLLAMPYASLDEIDFHRKDIGRAELEARVRFTLHLAGQPNVAAKATP